MTKHANVNGNQTQGSDPDKLETVQAAFRLTVGKVPGTGPVLGVWYYEDQVLAFRLQDSGSVSMFESTADGWIEKKGGLTPGGRYEFVSHNFGQKTKVYGVSGVHKAFEWDGSTWTDITTGMNPDKPDHVMATSDNYLWLSVGTQIESSPVANPTGVWSLRNGSQLINTVGDVTGMIVESGNLVVFDRSKIWIHYGTPLESDERFDNLTDKTGAIEWSVQTIGRVRYLDDFGLTTLQSTDQHGDFDHSAFSEAIRPLIVEKKASVLSSLAIRQFNEYVLFLDDGRAIACDFKRESILGFSIFNYGINIHCAVSGDDSSGTERLFVGASDGYVYELEKGTSFDGSDIEAYAMFSYHHFGYPRRKKRYRRLAIDVDTQDALSLKVRADYDYGGKSMQELVRSVIANEGLHVDDTWVDYTTAPEPASQHTVPLYGSGKTMAVGIYYLGSQNRPFTIQTLLADVSLRARQRK